MQVNNILRSPSYQLNNRKNESALNSVRTTGRGANRETSHLVYTSAIQSSCPAMGAQRRRSIIFYFISASHGGFLAHSRGLRRRGLTRGPGLHSLCSSGSAVRRRIFPASL